jgi:integrase
VNVLVRKGDKQISKTFDTKAEAQKWATLKERELNQQPLEDMTVRQKETFAMVMQEYKAQVTPTKSQAADEASYLDCLCEADFAIINLMHLKLKHLTGYRDKRLVEDGVSPATVARDFRIMKAVATYAPELGFPSVPAELFKKVPLPRTTERPVRRVTDEEFDGLLWACKPSNPRRTDNALYMAPLLQLALATGMRQGELCSLEWWMVDRTAGAITLPSAITKTGKQRIIPITGRAEEALDALQGLYGAKGRVLGDVNTDRRRTRLEARSNTVRASTSAFTTCGHESISRFFEMGCTIPEVMTISGHKTVAALDIYTHANTSSLIARLKGV